MQLREVPLHPLGQAAVVAALVGDNQRLIPQVGGAPAPSPRQAHTRCREAGSLAPHETNARIGRGIMPFAKWVQAQPARLNKADEIFAQTQHRGAGSWAPNETNT